MPGKTQRMSTNHAANMVTGTNQSHIVPPFSVFIELLTSASELAVNKVNYILNQE
jgi:hypothetical protein